jgi:hypothetical protein
VILVSVIPVMGKDKIGIKISPNFLEPILDRRPLAWEITFTKRSDSNLAIGYAREKFIRTLPSLLSATPWGAKNDPPDLQIEATLFRQSEEGASSANLNVVGMCPQAQDPTRF